MRRKISLQLCRQSIRMSIRRDVAPEAERPSHAQRARLATRCPSIEPDVCRCSLGLCLLASQPSDYPVASLAGCFSGGLTEEKEPTMGAFKFSFDALSVVAGRLRCSRRLRIDKYVLAHQETFHHVSCFFLHDPRRATHTATDTEKAVCVDWKNIGLSTFISRQTFDGSQHPLPVTLLLVRRPSDACWRKDTRRCRSIERREGATPAARAPRLFRDVSVLSCFVFF